MILDTGREYRHMMAHLLNGTAEVLTLGDLARGKARKSAGRPLRPAPKGCQWARDCDDCPWNDCVIDNEAELFPYDSEKAKATRREFLDRTRTEGMTIKELAAALRMSESSVKRQSTAKAVLKNIREEEMARMHREGMGVADIAERFGVHARTAARALAVNLGASEPGRHRTAKNLTPPPPASSARMF